MDRKILFSVQVVKERFRHIVFARNSISTIL